MTNFKSKNFISVLIIYLALFLMCSIIPLVIPFAKSEASWIVYCASILSILISSVIFYTSFKSSKTLKSKLYSMPIYKVAILYSLLQTLASIVIYVVDGLITCPTWISIVCVVVLFALAVIGLSINAIERNYVENVDDKVENKTMYFDNIMTLFDLCLSNKNNNDIINKLTDLKQSIKYCDPVSNEQSKEVELEIISNLEIIKASIENNDFKKAIDVCNVVEALIDKRKVLVKFK